MRTILTLWTANPVARVTNLRRQGPFIRFVAALTVLVGLTYLAGVVYWAWNFRYRDAYASVAFVVFAAHFVLPAAFLFMVGKRRSAEWLTDLYLTQLHPREAVAGVLLAPTKVFAAFIGCIAGGPLLTLAAPGTTVSSAKGILLVVTYTVYALTVLYLQTIRLWLSYPTRPWMALLAPFSCLPYSLMYVVLLVLLLAREVAWGGLLEGVLVLTTCGALLWLAAVRALHHAGERYLGAVLPRLSVPVDPREAARAWSLLPPERRQWLRDFWLWWRRGVVPEIVFSTIAQCLMAKLILDNSGGPLYEAVVPCLLAAVPVGVFALGTCIVVRVYASREHLLPLVNGRLGRCVILLALPHALVMAAGNLISLVRWMTQGPPQYWSGTIGPYITLAVCAVVLGAMCCMAVVPLLLMHRVRIVAYCAFCLLPVMLVLGMLEFDRDSWKELCGWIAAFLAPVLLALGGWGLDRLHIQQTGRVAVGNLSTGEPLKPGDDGVPDS